MQIIVKIDTTGVTNNLQRFLDGMKDTTKLREGIGNILESKGAFRGLGRMFDRSHTLIYRWVCAFGEALPEPEVPGGIQEMEFDEMWHFVKSKKQTLGHQSP